MPPETAVNLWILVPQFLANVATVVGLAGVIVAYRQFRAGALAQKQTTAITAWNDYLKLALAHPDFSRPDASILDDADSPVLSQYRWFVALMLFACEQILEAHPDDAAWQRVVAGQLNYHRDFLKSKHFVPAIYSDPVRRIAVEIRENGFTLPAPAR